MYKQIISAQNWFFVEDTNNHLTLYYLAAWALTEEGDVIGLISVENSQQFDTNNKMARLVTVPPHPYGMYKHKDELLKDEIIALNHNGHIKKSDLVTKQE